MVSYIASRSSGFKGLTSYDHETSRNKLVDALMSKSYGLGGEDEEDEEDIEDREGEEV